MSGYGMMLGLCGILLVALNRLPFCFVLEFLLVFFLLCFIAHRGSLGPMHSLTSGNGRLAFLAVGAEGCLLRRGPQFARQDKAGVPKQGDEPARWCHQVDSPSDQRCRSFALVGVPDGKPLIHRSLGHRERMPDSSVFFRVSRAARRIKLAALGGGMDTCVSRLKPYYSRVSAPFLTILAPSLDVLPFDLGLSLL